MVSALNPQVARELADNHNAASEIECYVEQLNKRINELATKGAYSMPLWGEWSHLTPRPNSATKIAIVQHYVDHGYTVKQFSNLSWLCWGDTE